MISMLVGPDNRSDYWRVGEVAANSIRAFGRYGDEVLLNHFYKLAREIQGPVVSDDHWSLMRAATCCVCNKKLTTPVSIAAGIGPVCAGRDNPHVSKTIAQNLRRLFKLEKQVAALGRAAE